MGRYLKELGPVVGAEREKFEAEPTLYHTAERIVELLVECAADVNTEVAQAVASIPPSDYYSSFFSMSQVGWIDRETAGDLAEMARLRNTLIHLYEEVTIGELHTKLTVALPSWNRYLAAVHTALERTASP